MTIVSSMIETRPCMDDSMASRIRLFTRDTRVVTLPSVSCMALFLGNCLGNRRDSKIRSVRKQFGVVLTSRVSRWTITGISSITVSRNVSMVTRATSVMV